MKLVQTGWGAVVKILFRVKSAEQIFGPRNKILFHGTKFCSTEQSFVPLNKNLFRGSGGSLSKNLYHLEKLRKCRYIFLRNRDVLKVVGVGSGRGGGRVNPPVRFAFYYLHIEWRLTTLSYMHVLTCMVAVRNISITTKSFSIRAFCVQLSNSVGPLFFFSILIVNGFQMEN